METKEKHSIQLNNLVSSLLSIIPNDMNEIIGIEMGAGKGTLSASIHEKNLNWNHLLVDIQRNFRNKAEKKVSDDDDSKFKRIHLDIKDLHLGLAIEDLFKINNNVKIILYAKHLCGLALDLSLRCIANTLDQFQNQIFAVSFASCCHHRCDWNNYCSM